MMNSFPLFQDLAFLALAFSILVFAWKLHTFNRLAQPGDQANPRGNTRSGILYAYTLGMAPWSKESTRLHWLAYLRGVAFHLGIFLGLGILVAGPWLSTPGSPLQIVLALGAGAGALLGLFGFAARFFERNLKALSNPDDYAAVLLVSLFLGFESLWISGILPGSIFYLSAALMLVYAPFSKIRHCIYYAYSRLFFGKFVGSRGVLPHKQQTLSLSREGSPEVGHD